MRIIANMLEVKDLRVHYGLVEVIKNISIAAGLGEIVSLIGANGAGKTTTLRVISGLKGATSCEIWFQGKRIDGLPAHKIVSLGLAHCPEGKRIFYSMKVIDNLLLGAFLRKDKKAIASDLAIIYGYFPVLRMRNKQLAVSLSGGEQQMLAMGRALMSRPKLLLLDEPSLGLAPLMVAEIGRIIKNIHESGVSIVLVEQNARMAFNLSKRVYVLEVGKIALTGSSIILANDERVKKAYFGGH
jgi:branched-chain amino acid transport system ATP-binding protein